MKKLSDYKGEEAIELWADLFDPLSVVLTDKELAQVVQQGGSKVKIASTILKNHKKEAEEILLRIDPTPIDGLNIVIRTVGIIAEIGKDETTKSFFGFAEQEKTDGERFGSATESTKADEK